MKNKKVVSLIVLAVLALSLVGAVYMMNNKTSNQTEIQKSQNGNLVPAPRNEQQMEDGTL